MTIMTEAEKKEAIKKAVVDFKKSVQSARALYREKVRAIMKRSDERKAQEIKKKL
jgi:hypothetical protein